jgi:hypothetical protein
VRDGGAGVLPGNAADSSPRGKHRACDLRLHATMCDCAVGDSTARDSSSQGEFGSKLTNNGDDYGHWSHRGKADCNAGASTGGVRAVHGGILAHDGSGALRETVRQAVPGNDEVDGERFVARGGVGGLS